MSNDCNSKEKAITDAAFALFVSKAYHEVRLEEIANQAGVAKGSIYTYFKSKEDLFLQLILNAIDKGKKQIDEVLAQSVSFKNKLSRLISTHIDFAKTDGRMLQIAIENLPKIVQNEKTFAIFKKKREEFITLLASMFAQGVKENSLNTSLTPVQLAVLFSEIFKVNHEFTYFEEKILTEKQIFEVFSRVLQLQ